MALYFKRLLLPLMVVLLMVFALSRCMYNRDVPPRLATGKQMYNDYCASCHRGSGLGKFILGVPPSFTNKMSRAQIVRLIREGDDKYSRMPTFPQIKFSQAQKIVNYLKTLEENQPR